jgi:hypothetical protein
MAAMAPVTGRHKPIDRQKARMRVNSGLNVNFMQGAPLVKVKNKVAASRLCERSGSLPAGSMSCEKRLEVREV